MELIEIEKTAWEQQRFEGFSGVFKTSLSVTANIDVSKLLEVTTERGIKFNSAFTFMGMTIANKYKQFRMRLNDKDNLSYYEYVHPVFTVPHKKVDGQFTISWTKYEPEFAEFNKNFIVDYETYRDTTNLFAREDLPPNFIVISPNPWLSFTNLSTINANDLYYAPNITSGKKFKENGKTLLPVSMSINHMFADGYHLGLFFNGLQELSDTCDEWLTVNDLLHTRDDSQTS